MPRDYTCFMAEILEPQPPTVVSLDQIIQDARDSLVGKTIASIDEFTGETMLLTFTDGCTVEFSGYQTGQLMVIFCDAPSLAVSTT